MHARAGLKTEYLSDDYAKAVEACIKEGERLGMFACLYDEDCFPSGNAAGFVTKDHPEFAARCIILREGEPADYTAPDGKSYRFDEEISPASARWGYPPPDILSRGAMARFIEVTHEWYKERFGQYFGADFSSVVPSVFSDEPNINPHGAYRDAPDVLGALIWSPCLEEEFRKRKGYNVRSIFPQMFFEIPGYEKARFDYYDVAAAVFVESFTKQIYDWCEKNNLDFTCHYWEHNYPFMSAQGDPMAHYEFLQIPGIDMLFNTPEEYEHEQFGFDLIVKEVSSAALHTGKKRVMSETHGAGGWNVSFRDQKRMLDWQFALGINYVVPHLFYLSMQGSRKRDFPLCFIHEPWWDEYRLLADYIGRLCYILSEGSFAADTLVLHNCSTALALYSPAAAQDSGEYKYLYGLGEETRAALTALSAEQVYYDLGSEILLERHAKAENGKICIGGMEYKYLVIPPSVTICESTLKLISGFKKSGGFIVCTGRKPDLADGVKSQELIDLLAGVPSAAVGELAGVLKANGAMGLNLTPANKESAENMHSVYVHERIIDGKRLLFFCNISRHKKAAFNLPVSGLVTEYNPETGKITDLAYEGSTLKVNLHACGSACYMIDEAAPALRPAAPETAEAVIQKCGDFKVSRDGDNMLAINHCAAETAAGGGWKGAGTPQQMELELRRHLTPELAFDSRQPWKYTKEEKEINTRISARYIFNAGGDITRLRVAAEYPDDFDVCLNGIKLEPDGGYFVDRDIVTYQASHALKQGENVIGLLGSYNIENTIESVYVLGDFTVECRADGGVYTLKSDAMPGLGDAAKQGHPFYSGKLTYEAEIEVEANKSASGRLFARLEGFCGSAARVRVNGEPAAALGWEPYEADITDFVTPGKNTLEVDVYSSAQNIFGPHEKSRVPGIVTPGSFYPPDGGVFEPFGLFGGVSVVRRG
jgi:hypothetical protein